jgi:hypothetical protein
MPPTTCDSARTFIISTPALLFVVDMGEEHPDTADFAVPSGESSRSEYSSLRPLGQLLLVNILLRSVDEGKERNSMGATRWKSSEYPKTASSKEQQQSSDVRLLSLSTTRASHAMKLPQVDIAAHVCRTQVR